jgi:hypothetical protein
MARSVRHWSELTRLPRPGIVKCGVNRRKNLNGPGNLANDREIQGHGNFVTPSPLLVRTTLITANSRALLLSGRRLGVMVMAVVMVRACRGKCRSGEQQNDGQDQKSFHALSLTMPRSRGVEIALLILL